MNVEVIFFQRIMTYSVVPGGGGGKGKERNFGKSFLRLDLFASPLKYILKVRGDQRGGKEEEEVGGVELSLR